MPWFSAFSSIVRSLTGCTSSGYAEHPWRSIIHHFLLLDTVLQVRFFPASDPWLVLWGCSPKYPRSNMVMHPKYCLLVPLINPFGDGSNAGRSRMLRKKSFKGPASLPPPSHPNGTYLKKSSRWSLQEGCKMEVVNWAFLRLFWMYNIKNHKKRFLIQVIKG